MAEHSVSTNRSLEIDHADIVVTHSCNMRCSFCIDKFRGTSDTVVSLSDVDKFLSILRANTDKDITILLLGGDPSVVGEQYLTQIANLVHQYGFQITMSTNGVLKDTIIKCLESFDSIQITTHSDRETDFWRRYGNKINIKAAGDASFTYSKLQHFIEYTDKDFFRRSVSMYFTDDFRELCTDEDVWHLLDTLDWTRNANYEYAFYNGVRIKKCIHGVTNIADEPTIPKLYPNGNYNKTWCNEKMDDYLIGGVPK